MKKLEKLGKSILALSVLANTFMPITLVKAEGEFEISIVVEATEKYSLSVQGTSEIKVTITDDGTDFIVPQVSDSGTATASCTDTSHCKFVIPENKTATLNFQSSKYDLTNETTNTGVISPETVFSSTTALSMKTPATDPPPVNPGNNDPVERDSDAYLLWECGTKICYKYLENLDQNDRVNYIRANSIMGDNVLDATFDVSAKAILAPKVKFLERKTEIDANTVTIDDLKGPSGIDYEPTDEPIENNAFVSYANRNFKLIIYNEDYRAITLGDYKDFDYYPHEWTNQFERRESYDISGTTKENPAEVLGLMLQDNVIIKKLAYNDFVINSIEPLDVREDAVTVTPIFDSFNQVTSYSIEFKSNFYDKVVFKVTDNNNHEYYFMFNRRTIDPYIDVNPNTGEGKIVTEVFYDSSYSYTDYNVLANIVYKDGTHKLVKQSPIIYGDAKIYGIIDDYEFDDENPPDNNIPLTDRGKGIKRAKYAYSISRDELKKVDKVYFNVERSSSTKEFYSGNFAGSGKGNILEMKYWEDKI